MEPFGLNSKYYTALQFNFTCFEVIDLLARVLGELARGVQKAWYTQTLGASLAGGPTCSLGESRCESH